MTIKKRMKGQASTEYLIVVGFIVFVLFGILYAGYNYSNVVSDKIKVDQLTKYLEAVISSAESINFHGEPSKGVIDASLPRGVQQIQLINYPESGDVIGTDIVVKIQLSSGESDIAFRSSAVLVDSSTVGKEFTLAINSGLKKISMEAMPPNPGLGITGDPAFVELSIG